MKLSYDEFDEKCTKMEEVNEAFPTKPYFPSEEEIIAMSTDLNKYFDHIVYLVSTNPAPITPVEVNSMKLLNKVISDNTEFID